MFGRKKKKQAGKKTPFWEEKPLDEMTSTEWESLCDGCGKCCLNKLEDERTGKIVFTNVACRLLDHETCRCSSYEERQRFVPDCRRLTPQNVGQIPWLPSTCAYRVLAEGGTLEWWHPLISGDPDTVFEAGISVKGRIVSERDTDDLEDYVVDWPK
jgi:uncharacterized cysteine cluster protein YcgN (CxxCxxCC family)